MCATDPLEKVDEAASCLTSQARGAPVEDRETEPKQSDDEERYHLRPQKSLAGLVR